MKKEEGFQKYISNFIDLIFSKDARKYVLLIAIIGAILRFMVINNVGVLADEMLHGPHAMNIISSGVINLQNECPAWFYLTDLAYHIFGVTAFGARFLSFFFGVFTIFLIYLIGAKLATPKIALISSILLSFSAYTIRYSLMEMDISMIFFVLLGFYYFIKDIENNTLSYYPAIFLGISILIKPIALPFIASFILYPIFFVGKSENRLSWLKTNLKKIIVSAIIILLFAMPIISFNIILHEQKGITDVLFSRFFKINQSIYSGLQGYDKSFSAGYLVSEGIPWIIKDSFFKLDPAITLLGILGIFLIFSSSKYKNSRFFGAFHLLPLIFLTGTSLLQTHFVSFMPFLCFSAAVFIDFISDKLSPHINSKRLIQITLFIVIIINLIVLAPYLTSQSGIFKLRNYAISDISNNAIVITDGRIYGGQIAWMFNDKNYLNAQYFGELLNINNNLTNKVSTEVYFIECTAGDCGWGTIKDQPDFNKSMEDFFGLVKKSSEKVQVINGGGGYEKTDSPQFTVYKMNYPISPSIYPTIKNTHVWFYYPVRWELSDWYDKYSPNTSFQQMLQFIGKSFLWIAIILAVISPIILLKEFFNNPIQSTIL